SLASSSITEVGGIRPPRPITVAAGRRLPCDRTVTVGDTSSVVDKFESPDAPPGRNSLTVAFTRTASPTLIEAGALPVKTKIPSEVAGSESGLGSRRLNPSVRFAVTIPGPSPNVGPRRGAPRAPPWISPQQGVGRGRPSAPHS